MATTLKQGVEIINQSLKTLGYEYQIDTTDNSTMTAGIEAVGAYAPSQRNAIMEQMNLIIQQRNYGVMLNEERNDFRRFLVGMEDNGFGIEDVFHELIEGRTPLWDGNATTEEIAKDLVSYDSGKVHKFFHTSPMSNQYKTTIDRRNYDKVFTEYGVTRYIDTKLANLSWSAEKGLMNEAISVIQDMISDSKIVLNEHNNLNTENGVIGTIEAIRSTMAGFKTPTDLYNYGVPTDSGEYKSVINMSDTDEDIFLLITPEAMERMRVRGLANAFNLSEMELQGRIMYLPAGTDLGAVNGEQVYCVAIDRRAILMGLRRWEGTSFFVPNTGIVNQWLTYEGVKGYNTIFNAVAFTGEAVDEFEPSVSQKYITVTKNTSDWNDAQTFINGVLATNFAPSTLQAVQVPYMPLVKQGSEITITTGVEQETEAIVIVDGVSITIGRGVTKTFIPQTSIELKFA